VKRASESHLVVIFSVQPQLYRSSSVLSEELSSIISRLHSVVIGPGLGRDDYMQEAAKITIQLCIKNKKHLVIDADGLWLIGKEPKLISGYDKVILTPNVVEFGRLLDAMVNFSRYRSL
jgi:ATP-dependent NAD(P)H-hydrate dehydratase